MTEILGANYNRDYWLVGIVSKFLKQLTKLWQIYKYIAAWKEKHQWDVTLQAVTFVLVWFGLSYHSTIARQQQLLSYGVICNRNSVCRCDNVFLIKQSSPNRCCNSKIIIYTKLHMSLDFIIRHNWILIFCFGMPHCTLRFKFSSSISFTCTMIWIIDYWKYHHTSA